MQVELLNRQRWNTRIQLANATFEYLEIWHDRHRRHTALGWLSPVEFETQNTRSPRSKDSKDPTPPNRGHPRVSTEPGVVQHRLYRGADRQANASLYRVVRCRMPWDLRTCDYVERRTKQGLSKNEIVRRLKRMIARELYYVLRPAQPAEDLAPAA